MRIHLIGIGGIGISGLAKFLFFEGHEISGSDQKGGKIIDDLEKLGAKINFPHSADAIKDIDLIIHSAIIKPTNVEIVRAKELNIPILSRKEALLTILKDKKVFSVCGAHGKSTTTAILSAILETSSIIGAYSKLLKSNISYKKNSPFIVFEADESDGSFLNSNPFYSIVTNAEPEHMEYYNYDVEKFYSAYKTFLEISEKRLINAEDNFLKDFHGEAIRLFPSKDIKNIQSKLIDGEPFIEFELLDLGKFSVWGFGDHIALDASLAILTALDFGLSKAEIREKLLTYRGIEKRFDILQKRDDFILIDDYGHHPTEIEATLKSAFQYAKMVGIDEVIAIWQPHKYSRTVDNLDHFQSCFGGVSKLVLLPVWEAGEKAIDIDFKKLFSRYSPIFSDNLSVKKGEVSLSNGEKFSKGLIIGFGAGDITYQLRKI
jgi:UDP-N-acetylmuramate--alanine ligase